MRIAHLIMAHKHPFQLERLIRVLTHTNFDIYIHLDKKVDLTSYRYVEEIERVYFIEGRVVCNWGGFSFVKAINSSLSEILSKNIKYDFVNLLSAQDYPIKPINYIYKYLEKHKEKNFITYEKTNNCDWWRHAVTRYERYHFTDINIRGRYVVQNLLNTILPKRKFPLNCRLYGSANSSWWTIRPDCARHILDYLAANKDLMKFMRFTWTADEFLYPTIIMNSVFKDSVINNNLRHIEWEDGSPNPRIFEKSDLDSLLASHHLFARKFDYDEDLEILDRIDRVIHSKQSNHTHI